MIKAQVKKVKQYLHSIKRTELAIYNLTKSLADLETRRNSPPTWMHNPDIGGGGGDSGSKQEAWVEFLDGYDDRKSYLLDTIKRDREKVDQFNRVLAELSKEGPNGPLASHIIRHKYYDKIAPDSTIYLQYLFCSERLFYKVHRFALDFFFDALPDRFGPNVQFSCSKNA